MEFRLKREPITLLGSGIRAPHGGNGTPMTRDIERRDFLALCGLGVLGAQTVMDGASEPAEDSEPVVNLRMWDGDPGYARIRQHGPPSCHIRLDVYEQPHGFLSAVSLGEMNVGSQFKLSLPDGHGGFISGSWMLTRLQSWGCAHGSTPVMALTLASLGEVFRSAVVLRGHHRIDATHVIDLDIEFRQEIVASATEWGP